MESVCSQFNTMIPLATLDDDEPFPFHLTVEQMANRLSGQPRVQIATSPDEATWNNPPNNRWTDVDPYDSFSIPPPGSFYNRGGNMRTNRGGNMGRTNQYQPNQTPQSENSPYYNTRKTSRVTPPSRQMTHNMVSTTNDHATKPENFFKHGTLGYKIKSNGSIRDFESYVNKIKGHINQNGLGYTNEPEFLEQYFVHEDAYLQTLDFQTKYQVTYQQAQGDSVIIYGVFQSSIAENIIFC